MPDRRKKFPMKPCTWLIWNLKEKNHHKLKLLIFLLSNGVKFCPVASVLCFWSSQVDGAAPAEPGQYNFFFGHDAVITSSALKIKHSNNTSMAGLEWVNEYPIKRKGIWAKYLPLEEEHFLFLGQKATNCSQLIAYEYQGLMSEMLFEAHDAEACGWLSGMEFHFLLHLERWSSDAATRKMWARKPRTVQGGTSVHSWQWKVTSLDFHFNAESCKTAWRIFPREKNWQYINTEMTDRRAFEQWVGSVCFVTRTAEFFTRGVQW